MCWKSTGLGVSRRIAGVVRSLLGPGLVARPPASPRCRLLGASCSGQCVWRDMEGVPARIVKAQAAMQAGAPATAPPASDASATDRAGGGPEVAAVSQMQEARQFIEQYKLPGEPVVLHPSTVGFDVCNRDGIPMDGARCDELLGQIADMGWDPEEANYGNIAVEARPDDDELQLHNHRACEGSEFLAPLEGTRLGYGTLSHSHLHQCLKNIRAGAPAKAPTAFLVNGRLSLEAIERAQPDLARSARHGLAWTILSWKIRDNPLAMQIIQGAANRRASVAMKETAMQAVARLAMICDRACGAGGKVSYQEARKVLAHTMPEVVDSGEFLGLLRFVVNLGAGKAPFIPYMKEFFGLRGGNRQVRPATFALAGQLGSTVPHVACGLVIMALTAPHPYFVEGVSRFLTVADVRELQDKESGTPGASVRKTEEILAWFHRAGEKLKGKAGVDEQRRMDFLGRADSVLCRWLTKKHLGAYEDWGGSVDQLAEKLASELPGFSPQELQALRQGAPWEAVAEPPASSQGASSKGQLQPTVIRFEDGKAVNSQEQHREEVTTEDIQWITTLTFPQEEIAKHTLAQFLAQASAALHPAAATLVGMTRDSAGEVRLVALEKITTGGVALVPVVSGFAGIVARRATTYPPAAVMVDWMGVSLVILPSARLPPKKTQVKDWDKAAFCAPFWLVTRTALAGKGNCVFAKISMMTRHTLKYGEPPLSLDKKSSIVSAAGDVPVIIPQRDIEKGEELVMQVDPPAPKKRQEAVSTWETQKKARSG